MPNDPVDRPSTEELDEIRRRLAQDGRADGAATLDALAEALGVPVEAVRATLERIREERAFRPAPRKDQRPMLALAVFLLGAAVVIHRLNPRALSDEERVAQAEEAVAEIRAHRKAHPVVHYPILSKVKTGALPPSGFDIELRGPLTTTTMASAGGPPKGRFETIAALSSALANGYRAAVEAEAAAPPPPRPIPRKEFWMSSFPPDSIAYTIANSQGHFEPTRLAAMSPEERNRTIVGEAEAAARSIVDGAIAVQESTLKPQPLRSSPNYTLPPGFALEFRGLQTMQIMQSQALRVLPVDPVRVAKTLEAALRARLWSDLAPPEYSTPETRAAFAKKPMPAFVEVVLRGPITEQRFRLPMTASKAYPTAAAAARAADRILVQETRRAAAQVAALNAGRRTP